MTTKYGDISPRTAAYVVKDLLKRGMPVKPFFKGFCFTDADEDVYFTEAERDAAEWNEIWQEFPSTDIIRSKLDELFADYAQDSTAFKKFGAVKSMPSVKKGDTITFQRDPIPWRELDDDANN